MLFRLISLFRYTASYCDQGFLLYAAQRVLGGAQISGPQLVEGNPPLIIWFSTLPVILGHALNSSPFLMLKVIVFSMIGVSALWSARILRIVGAVNSPALLYATSASVLSAEILLKGWVFAEREHLLVILILPYIFSAIFAGRSRLRPAELCILGTAAGIAVCFKPQHALILVALELFLAIWNRSLRRLLSPDLLFAALAVFAYVVIARLAVPLYFTATLPLLRETYWAFGWTNTHDLIRSERYFILFSCLALVAFDLTRHKLRFSIAPGAFLACSLASSIAFYVQHDGGPNRAYPQCAFLFLAICWIAIEKIPPAVAARWKFSSQFAASSLILTLALLPFLNKLREFGPIPRSLPDTVFPQYPPQTSVFLFSITPVAFPAVTQHHLVWASRFLHLWMLPAIVQNESAEAGGPAPRKVLPPDVVAQLAALQRVEVAEDIRRWKPAVVVVSRCQRLYLYTCYGLEYGFDLLGWFQKSPQFAAEWANYRFQTSQDDFDVYTRIPGATR